MSEEKKPRTPGEQWDAVMQAAMGPEARELEEASDEEIDRELRAAGINPDRLAADGNALAARLMREAGIGGGDRETEKENDREHDHEHEHEHEHERDHDHDHDHDHDREGGNAPVAAVLADANVLPFAPVAARKRPRWPLLLVAAALGAGVTKVAVTVAERDRTPVEPRFPEPAPVGPEKPERSEVALRLREDAARELATRNYQACLDLLDRARELDPAGDNTEETRRLRKEATAALTADAAPRHDKKAPK